MPLDPCLQLRLLRFEDLPPIVGSGTHLSQTGGKLPHIRPSLPTSMAVDL